MRVIRGGTLRLSRCGFRHNHIAGEIGTWHSFGGALDVTESHANVSDCTFRNNSAPLAGAIGFISSTFHITGSLFVDGHAVDHAGAIGVYPQLSFPVIPSRGVIEHCKFVVRPSMSCPAPHHGVIH